MLLNAASRARAALALARYSARARRSRAERDNLTREPLTTRLRAERGCAALTERLRRLRLATCFFFLRDELLAILPVEFLAEVLFFLLADCFFVLA